MCHDEADVAYAACLLTKDIPTIPPANRSVLTDHDAICQGQHDFIVDGKLCQLFSYLWILRSQLQEQLEKKDKQVL